MQVFIKTGFKRLLYRSWMLGVCLLGSWSLGIPSVTAAEQLRIRLGFLEQTISLNDLEDFAQTGRISASLEAYRQFLTPQVRQALTMQLPLNPQSKGGAHSSLLKSAQQTPGLSSLVGLLPKQALGQLESALSGFGQNVDNLSVMALLRAYPSQTIDLDATLAVSLLSQLNPSFLGTQILSPRLEKDLAPIPPTGSSNFSFDPAVAGTYPIQRQTLSLRDRTRQRTIPVEIAWSQATPPSPLVVISHGLGADRTFLRYLADHLASHGFTVAAVEHPRSDNLWVQQATTESLNLATVLPPSEFIDRPLDISFLLDELTQLNRQPGQWQGQFGTDQVTVIGHSLGGTTALMLGGADLDLNAVRKACQNRNPVGKSPADWLQCSATNIDLKQWSQFQRSAKTISVRDGRVAQVVALNPMIANLFGETGLQSVQTPVLMLASTDDTLTPALSQQFRPFQQLSTPKYLVTAIGGTHLSVGDPGLAGKVAASQITREKQGSAAEPLRRLMRGVTLAFVRQLTPVASTYTQFLTPEYAQFISQPGLPLRLSTSVSTNLFSSDS